MGHLDRAAGLGRSGGHIRTGVRSACGARADEAGSRSVGIAHLSGDVHGVAEVGAVSAAVRGRVVVLDLIRQGAVEVTEEVTGPHDRSAHVRSGVGEPTAVSVVLVHVVGAESDLETVELVGRLVRAGQEAAGIAPSRERALGEEPVGPVLMVVEDVLAVLLVAGREILVGPGVEVHAVGQGEGDTNWSSGRRCSPRSSR